MPLNLSLPRSAEPRPLDGLSLPVLTLHDIHICLGTKSAVRQSLRLATLFNQRIGRDKIALSYAHSAV